jgi:hypothetical protein
MHVVPNDSHTLIGRSPEVRAHVIAFMQAIEAQRTSAA